MSHRARVGCLLSLCVLVVLLGCAGESASPTRSTAAEPSVPEPAATEPAAPTASAPSAPEPSPSAPPQAQGLAGLWMGLVSQYTLTGLYTPQIQFLIMYEDGTFYYALPLEGLEGFDRGKSRNDEKEYWGTYTFDGVSGAWQRAAYEPRPLEIDKDGNLKIGADPFYRCRPVDGLRLDGAWTTYADPGDPALGQGGLQPIIRFAADGTFQDEGLFAGGDFLLPDAPDSESVDEQAVAPGSGTYEIRNYTLFLTYDDGRVRRAAFNLYFGTEQQPSPDTIFIYRRHLQRM